jgi:hypothetical protein
MSQEGFKPTAKETNDGNYSLKMTKKNKFKFSNTLKESEEK